MKTKVLFLALLLALSLFVVGVVLANSVERPREVLGSGASDSAAGGASLHATLGQPVVGTVKSSGGDVTLGQGYWGVATPGYSIYLPLFKGDYQP
jgi:hypothetical protein